MRDKMYIAGAIAIFIIVISGTICLMAMIFGKTVKPEVLSKEYNNGICQVCGGNYHFSGGNRFNYFYTCDNCDHTIETLNIMK